MENKFQIGDRVRVITKRFGERQFDQTGTIVGIDSRRDDLPIKVSTGFIYHPDHLENLSTAMVEDTRSYLEAVTGGVDGSSF